MSTEHPRGHTQREGVRVTMEGQEVIPARAAARLRTRVWVYRLFATVLLLLGLAPSLSQLAEFPDMPHFGHLSDDAIYWVSGKSLADGNGYRLTSYPGEPFQTKYPPLYPAILAILMKLNTQFPQNLGAAAMLAWASLPIFLLQLILITRRLGLAAWQSTTVAGVLAMHPAVVLYATSLMPDLLFCALAWSAFLLLESRRPPSCASALVAGILVAAAYLTRTAALPLLITVPLCCCLRKQYRQAICFILALGPVVVAWQWWVATHVAGGSDITLYYTDYLAYRLRASSWQELPLFVWTNGNYFLTSIGGLVVFELAHSPWGAFIARFIGLFTVVGVFRQATHQCRSARSVIARLASFSHYLYFAVCYAGILLLWHYPPNERFLLPLVPLLCAGFVTEVSNLRRLIAAHISPSARPSERLAAWLDGAAIAGLLAVALLNWHATNTWLYPIKAQLEAQRGYNKQAYQWIRNTTDINATFLSDDEASLFLHTGRKAIRLQILPTYFYRDDRAAIKKAATSLPDYMHSNHLEYLYLTPGNQVYSYATKEEVLDGIKAGAQLVYRSAGVVIFRLRR